MIKKAITFRASSIGDCLMGKYVLENIHAQFPDARLAIVVASRGMMIRDLCAAYPWLEVREVNRQNPLALLALIRDFYRSDFVLTQYAGKKGGRFALASKLVARLLAKKGGMVGFVDASRINRFLYDHLLSYSMQVAIAEHEREALRVAQVPVTLPFPTLIGIADGGATVRKFGLRAGAYSVVHLFSGSTARGLHPDKKRALLIALTKEMPEMLWVLSGGKGDRDEALRVAEGLHTIVIAGEASLQEMLSILAQSRGVVSLDTGIAHMTAELGKPLTVLSSCLGANWWLPEQYGKEAPVRVVTRGDCCVAGHVYKEYPDCMNTIDMNDVARRVAVVL